jgi:hypothetical protein
LIYNRRYLYYSQRIFVRTFSFSKRKKEKNKKEKKKKRKRKEKEEGKFLSLKIIWD